MFKCIAIGITVCALLLGACSSTSDPNDPNNNNNNNTTFGNSFSGTMNGTSWSVADIYALKVASGGTIYGFTFVANDPVSERTVSIGVPLKFEVGTFSIGAGNLANAGFDDDTVSFGENVTGTITVTAITAEGGVKGSFSISGQSDAGATGTASGNFEATWDN